MIPCLFNEFKEASGKACEIWLKLELHGNFSNSANMDRPSCHVWEVAISFSNLNFSNTEHVTTHYKSLPLWIGLNVTLPHTLQHVLPYILFEIWLVLGHLQCITSHYLFFFLIINIYLLINLMVTQSNALQIAPKPC